MANFAVEINMAQGVLVGGSGSPKNHPLFARPDRPAQAMPDT